MQNYLILVAGGTGNRMGSEIPKQFLQLSGKPVMYYAIQQFLNADAGIKIIIVIHPMWKKELGDVLKEYFSGESFEIVEGGATRFHSVKNGLDRISGDGVVCIHDAARPIVSMATISRCIAAAEEYGSAVPVVKMNESMRHINAKGSEAVNREEYRVVQTPQSFLIKPLKLAFEQEYHSSFTDDATVFEKSGGSVHLVEGNPENIKITLPSDLLLAEAMLNNRLLE